MQENTFRARLPARIFFVLVMIAVIGFVVFQQNRSSDVPPEASVKPPEQPVIISTEAASDPISKTKEITDSNEILSKDQDETPQQTDSALESGAVAKVETAAEVSRPTTGGESSVGQQKLEAANDPASGVTLKQIEAEIAAEETHAPESTEASEAILEEAGIAIDEDAVVDEAEIAVKETQAAESTEAPEAILEEAGIAAEEDAANDATEIAVKQTPAPEAIKALESTVEEAGIAAEEDAVVSEAEIAVEETPAPELIKAPEATVEEAGIAAEEDAAVSEAEIAAEEMQASELTEAIESYVEEAGIAAEEDATDGDAKATQPTSATGLETSDTKTANADASAKTEGQQKQPAAEVTDQVEAPTARPTAEDVDVRASIQTHEEKVQAAIKGMTDPTAEEKKPLVMRPKIETIRIEEDGAVLIAGLVGPDQAVDVLVNDVALITLYADGSGNFVGFFDLPHSSELRFIGLRVGSAEAYVFSDQDFLVLPAQIAAPLTETIEAPDEANIVLTENAEVSFEATSEASISGQDRATQTSKSDLSASRVSTKSSSAAAVPETEGSGNKSASEDDFQENQRTNLESAEVAKPADDGAAQVSEELKVMDAQPKETATVQSISKESVESPKDPSKPPKVLIADKDGVRVVQPEDSLDEDAIALDAISYDGDGEVMLSGRSNPIAYLRIYLDNAPVLLVRPDDGGNWTTLLSNVDPGVYTLRIDQVDSVGKVMSRLETPFKKESPQKLLSYIRDTKTEARINVVTVQPGYTLWAIARKRYGRGILYVRVFEANRDKIRDPDLIYPGQVFDLPD